MKINIFDVTFRQEFLAAFGFGSFFQNIYEKCILEQLISCLSSY